LVIMEFGTPKWWMMSVKNFTVSLDLIMVISLTSIHFENLSTATSKCVWLVGALFRGLTRSRPQTTKGHMMRIVSSASARRCVCRGSIGTLHRCAQLGQH
jgi:hypothetical protein